MHILWLQVVANYVAMVPNGTIFDNSLEKGKPYDVRVGAGQVRLSQKLNHGNLSAAVHLAQGCFVSTVVQFSAADFKGRLQHGCFHRLPGSLSDADVIVLIIPYMTPCPNFQVAQSWTL